MSLPKFFVSIVESASEELKKMTSPTFYVEPSLRVDARKKDVAGLHEVPSGLRNDLKMAHARFRSGMRRTGQYEGSGKGGMRSVRPANLGQNACSGSNNERR